MHDFVVGSFFFGFQLDFMSNKRNISFPSYKRKESYEGGGKKVVVIKLIKVNVLRKKVLEKNKLCYLKLVYIQHMCFL